MARLTTRPNALRAQLAGHRRCSEACAIPETTTMTNGMARERKSDVFSDDVLSDEEAC